jgi:sulfonate transport system permease protein
MSAENTAAPRATAATASAATAASERFQRIAGQLILPAALLVLWEVLSSRGYVAAVFLPRPSAVVEAFYYLIAKDQLLLDFRTSAVIVVKGFFAGTTIGLAAGFACGISAWVERFLGPTLNAIRQVPTLAWLPLILLWVGAGDLGKTVIIAKAVFFPVFLNTLQGIRGTSREHIEVGRVFAFGRLRLLWHIVLPSALPGIFIGLRYGAGLSWAVLIVAEMLGARRGLGFILMRSQELLHSDQLFVVIIIIGFVGYVIDVGLRRLEKYLLRWKRGYEG